MGIEGSPNAFLRRLAPLAAASIAVAGCASSPAARGPERTSPTTLEVTADGDYSAEGSTWHIVCRGSQTYVVTEGETLGSVIAEAPVIIGNPSGIGQSAMPYEAVAEAVADVAGLENPDVIQIGRLTVPEVCTLQPFKH